MLELKKVFYEVKYVVQKMFNAQKSSIVGRYHVHFLQCLLLIWMSLTLCKLSIVRRELKMA